MVQLTSKVAFVTGANGISGNAIVEHLIRTPENEWYCTTSPSRYNIQLSCKASTE